MQASRAATAIFGQFRRSDGDDPEVFYQAAKALFMCYPEEIVVALCHPKTGIAGEQTFLPAIAEMRASLDRRLDVVTGKARRDRESEETQRFLAAPERPATEAERRRAAARWERQKAEITGRALAAAEDEREAAARRLPELYRKAKVPVSVSPALSDRLAAMRASAA